MSSDAPKSLTTFVHLGHGCLLDSSTGMLMRCVLGGWIRVVSGFCCGWEIPRRVGMSPCLSSQRKRRSKVTL